jgi:AraC family transcriptional regulator
MSATGESGTMYDEYAISSNKADVLPAGARVALSVDYQMAEAALVSLRRLEAAFVELSTALNETLRDERSNAAACLQRAQAMLRGSGRTSPRATQNSARQGLAPWQLRRVLAHIEANLGMPIRNKDLAAIAHLSTFHFSFTFRNSVGNSPHEYIIRRRMERAQGLMLSTDKALSEIASECGMADQAHFTRLFRRVVGDSPGAWRRARAEPAQ